MSPPILNEPDLWASNFALIAHLARRAGVGKRPFANPTKDFVELWFADEEGIMLWGDLAVGIHEIDINVVAGLDY